MKKLLFVLFLSLSFLNQAWANSGWYSTLQGAASDVEQSSPPNGVTIYYNTTDHMWEFSYALAPAGGTTGQVLTKNSSSNYDYSWANAGVTLAGTTGQFQYNGGSSLSAGTMLSTDGTNVFFGTLQGNCEVNGTTGAFSCPGSISSTGSGGYVEFPQPTVPPAPSSGYDRLFFQSGNNPTDTLDFEDKNGSVWPIGVNNGGVNWYNLTGYQKGYVITATGFGNGAGANWESLSGLSGINWNQISGSQNGVGVSGFNWQSAQQVLQSINVNWNDINRLNSLNGINWNSLTNYLQGEVLEATPGIGLGVNWEPVSGTGTVTSVSVNSSNGLTSSVSSPTTAPAITLTPYLSMAGINWYDGQNMSQGINWGNSGQISTGPLTSYKTGIGATATDGIEILNNTPATVGTQQYSPNLHLSGQGWSTTNTASQSSDWHVYNKTVSGSSNPTSQINFDTSVNGGAYANEASLTSAGTFTSTTLETNASTLLGSNIIESIGCTTGNCFDGAGGNVTSGIVFGSVGTATAITTGHILDYTASNNSYTGTGLIAMIYSGTGSGVNTFLQNSSASSSGDVLQLSGSGTGKALNVLSGSSIFAGLATFTGGINWQSIPSAEPGTSINWTNNQLIQQTSAGVNWNFANPSTDGINWYTVANGATTADLMCWKGNGQPGHCNTSITGVICATCS